MVGLLSSDNNLSDFPQRTFEALGYISLIAASILIFPLLRWLVDVARSLKIKSSTGDSEKLEAMQKEIDKLKKTL